MDVAIPDVGVVAEVSNAVEQAEKAVEEARAELARLQKHLLEQLQQLISKLNDRLPVDDKLEEIGNRSPEQYLSNLREHPIAGQAVDDNITNYFRGRFAAVSEAENKLRQAEVASERIVTPPTGSETQPTDEAKQYMHDIAEARDVIIRTEQNPYVMDRVWGERGQVDESGNITEKGSPGLAETERTNREAFTREVTNAVVRKMGIRWIKEGEKSDDPLYNYYERTFNKFLDEEIKRIQKTAPDYTFFQQEAYAMRQGFTNHRDPQDLYSQSSRSSAPQGSGAVGEKLAMMLGYDSGYPHLSSDGGREFIYTHLSSLQQFKALAEVDGGRYGVFPHAREWIEQRGNISGRLREMGLHIQEGEALMPEEWRSDPAKRAEVIAANAEYQAELGRAKQAVIEHCRKVVAGLHERLDAYKEEFDFYHRTRAEIDQVNTDGMPPEDLVALHQLESRLSALNVRRRNTSNRPTGMLRRYSPADKSRDLGAIDRDIRSTEQQIAECQRLGEDHRSARVGAINEERRSRGVSIGKDEFYQREIRRLETELEQQRRILEELEAR